MTVGVALCLWVHFRPQPETENTISAVASESEKAPEIAAEKPAEVTHVAQENKSTNANTRFHVEGHQAPKMSFLPAVHAEKTENK